MSISEEERDTQVDLMCSSATAALAAGAEYSRHSRLADLEEVVQFTDTASAAAEKLKDWNA